MRTKKVFLRGGPYSDDFLKTSISNKATMIFSVSHFYGRYAYANEYTSGEVWTWQHLIKH